MSDEAEGKIVLLRAEEVDGFFGADSMVRRLHRERVVAFSGLRALLMQACEPLGVIGFERHSIIFDDPRTRLLRTDERCRASTSARSSRRSGPAGSCARCTAGCAG